MTVPLDPKSLCLLHALLDDRCISFNIKRSPENISAFPRDIVAFFSSPAGSTIIPGVSRTKEKPLLKELRKVGRWRKAKEHSFDFNRKLFSLLWRFSGRNEIAKEQLSGVALLDTRDAKVVRTALKKYRAFLSFIKFLIRVLWL